MDDQQQQQQRTQQQQQQQQRRRRQDYVRHVTAGQHACSGYPGTTSARRRWSLLHQQTTDSNIPSRLCWTHTAARTTTSVSIHHV